MEYRVELPEYKNISISLRVTQSFYSRLEEQIKSKKQFRNISDTCIGLMEMGFELDKYIKIAKDENAVEQARKQLANVEKFNLGAFYFASLSDAEFENLKSIIKLENEKRIKKDLLNF